AASKPTVNKRTDIFFIEKTSKSSTHGLTNDTKTDVAETQRRTVIAISSRDADKSRRVVPCAPSHDRQPTDESATAAGATLSTAAAAEALSSVGRGRGSRVRRRPAKSSTSAPTETARSAKLSTPSTAAAILRTRRINGWTAGVVVGRVIV